MSTFLGKLAGTRTVRAAVIAAVAVTGLMVAPSGAAQAGESCTGGCSETHNRSTALVMAGRDWPNPSADWIWVSPGYNTPSKQDWDAFRVDAGYCYTVKWQVYGVTTSTKKYDQRGKGNLWVQVHNDEIAIVTHQSTTSSC